MQKTTNRCDIISRTPVYQPSLFTTLAVREGVRRNTFYNKALYSFPISGKQIIMSVSETEVKSKR